ncbi:hypothetical protein, partial [Corynebacterium striatum]|uniref:hypothetical protein n=1 Tax=Corynebacterium striatum TaxID=43770 RepID=UPI003B5CB6B0
VLRQDAILHQANDAVLRILIKFSWHVPDFPIYSNGTKPGTLQKGFGHSFGWGFPSEYFSWFVVVDIGDYLKVLFAVD